MKQPKQRTAVRRYSIDELPLAIVCPACQLFMGRCRDQATLETALRTHTATLCTHAQTTMIGAPQ